MLDYDLAILYEVETRVINQAIKRNQDRFPEDFMFRLSSLEWDSLRSQIVILENGRGKYPKYLPIAFTEHGVAMLASVLRTTKAVKMNIAIVRAFISLRQAVLQHKELAKKLEQLRTEMFDRLGEHDTQLKAIYDAIENLLDQKAVMQTWEERERIGFRK